MKVTKISYLELATQTILFTCQMHPQIEQKTPGNCPICGMTLELVGLAQGVN